MSKNIIRKSSSASLAILISRIAGLARDILVARYIGGGAVMSAWVLAFKIPNTFRGLLGEGAATQAVVPMMGHLVKRDGIDSARRQLGILLATLAVVLCIITFAVSAASIIFEPYFDVLRVNLALRLLPILMPYTIFVCLTAICCGILNLFGRFFWPAMSSVILNVAIILPLFIFYRADPLILVNRISWAVLISGFVQLAIMLIMLKKIDMFPYPFRPSLMKEPVIKEFINLTIPGFIGAAAMQVNSLVDSFIALYIGNYAAPALYFSERLIYLPVGIFAVSIANACLVTMSKHAAENKYLNIILDLRYSLKQIFYITLPVAVYFIVFRFSIITLVYGGDKFGSQDIYETAWAMLFYSFGIPAFCALKVIVSAFYSRKKMKTPVKVSLICIGINFILNLILMFPLQQGGIALATSISSVINCVTLLIILKKDIPNIKKSREVLNSFIKILFISIVAGGITYYFVSWLFNYSYLIRINYRDVGTVIISFFVFIFIYLAISAITKSKEQNEWFELIKGKLLK